ncbi:MAG: AmmeMemoRadiSam system radical SAM enzyme [Candidatus Auribacterota bacterium]
MMDRREFISNCLKGACALGLGHVLVKESDLFAALDSAGTLVKGNGFGDESSFVHEAMHFTRLGDGLVRCGLCPHGCLVSDGARGKCRVRENRGGTYYTRVFSRVCAMHVDPIEKKPLFHYKPASKSFSIATPGCNFSCSFCQNWQISQSNPESIDCQYISPDEAVRKAVESGAQSIAYTYSEPTIFYEYMLETARKGNEKGVKSVAITNGFMCEQAQDQLLDQLDAVKIDFKAFSENFYREVCGGTLEGVKKSIQRIAKKKKWLELVVLIIPTLNDSREEITAMAEWIAGEAGYDVPVHFSRFHPQYKLKNLPVTPVATLERCVDICRDKGLRYVYIGNAPGHPAENTYCPGCKEMVIKRYGFYVLSNTVKDGKCPHCGHGIAGIFS